MAGSPSSPHQSQGNRLNRACGHSRTAATCISPIPYWKPMPGCVTPKSSMLYHMRTWKSPVCLIVPKNVSELWAEFEACFFRINIVYLLQGERKIIPQLGPVSSSLAEHTKWGSIMYLRTMSWVWDCLLSLSPVPQPEEVIRDLPSESPSPSRILAKSIYVWMYFLIITFSPKFPFLLAGQFGLHPEC